MANFIQLIRNTLKYVWTAIGKMEILEEEEGKEDADTGSNDFSISEVIKDHGLEFLIGWFVIMLIMLVLLLRDYGYW